MGPLPVVHDGGAPLRIAEEDEEVARVDIAPHVGLRQRIFFVCLFIMADNVISMGETD